MSRPFGPDFVFWILVTYIDYLYSPIGRSEEKQLKRNSATVPAYLI